MSPEEVAEIFRGNMTNLVRESASRRRSRAAHPAFMGPLPIHRPDGRADLKLIAS